MTDDITPTPAEEPTTSPEPPADEVNAPDEAEIAALIGEAMVTLRDYGDVEGALALLEEAVQLAPDHMMVHFSRGMAHYMAGNFPAMVASLTKAIELEPENVISYSMRATAHLMMEDSAAALADLDTAVGIQPDNYQLIKQRAILHSINKDYAAAMADVQLAITLAPDEGELYYFRADLHYKLDNPLAALADLEESITRDPREPMPRRLRAEIWLEQGEYEQALAALEHLQQLEPGAEYIHADMALVRYALGQHVAAQKMWRLLINAVDMHYADLEWAKERLDWPDPLVELARPLVSSL